MDKVHKEVYYSFNKSKRKTLMTNKEIIEKYETRFKQSFVQENAEITCVQLNLEEDSVGKIVNILNEMNFSEFILNNTFRMEFTEDEYASYAQAQLSIWEIEDKLKNKLGSDLLHRVQVVANDKAAMWDELNSDIFIDKLFGEE